MLTPPKKTTTTTKKYHLKMLTSSDKFSTSNAIHTSFSQKSVTKHRAKIQKIVDTLVFSKKLP